MKGRHFERKHFEIKKIIFAFQRVAHSLQAALSMMKVCDQDVGRVSTKTAFDNGFEKIIPMIHICE